jgi:hypothetical protein
VNGETVDAGPAFEFGEARPAGVVTEPDAAEPGAAGPDLPAADLPPRSTLKRADPTTANTTMAHRPILATRGRRRNRRTSLFIVCAFQRLCVLPWVYSLTFACRGSVVNTCDGIVMCMIGSLVPLSKTLLIPSAASFTRSSGPTGSFSAARSV